VDAAARGYTTVLLEAHDFAKGTSSRSTKLIHGGVRYLAQGNISLVYDALRERGRLRRNAPHLVHTLPFVVPAYTWWAQPYYGAGLLLYNLLAGSLGLGSSWIILSATSSGGVSSSVMRPVAMGGQLFAIRALIHLLLHPGRAQRRPPV
jgi:glycerol-3-phosphate dehydrogenase